LRTLQTNFSELKIPKALTSTVC